MTLALATARASLKIRVQFREISIKYGCNWEGGHDVQLVVRCGREERRGVAVRAHGPEVRAAGRHPGDGPARVEAALEVAARREVRAERRGALAGLVLVGFVGFVGLV